MSASTVHSRFDDEDEETPVYLRWPFWTAFGCVALSVALLAPQVPSVAERFLGDDQGLALAWCNVAGWVLSSPVCGLLFAVYRFRDRALRKRGGYRLVRNANGRMRLVTVAGWVLGLVHAFFAARWWLA